MFRVVESLECRDKSTAVLREETVSSMSKARTLAREWAKERKSLPGYFVAGSASHGFYEFGCNDGGRVYGTIEIH